MTSQVKNTWKCRPYQPSDKEACLKIFNGNAEPPILSHEREDFIHYLEEQDGDYWVVEAEAGDLIACGGYAFGEEDGAATLCWGMADKKWHGQGLGQFLLDLRLSALAQIPGVRLVRMDTSQHSVGFFMKNRFKTYRITRNFYGPGLNRYEMYLMLDGNNVQDVLKA